MIIAIVLLIMVVIPSSIAYEVEGGENITSRVIEEDEILLRASASNDIYFDASAPAGGVAPAINVQNANLTVSRIS